MGISDNDDSDQKPGCTGPTGDHVPHDTHGQCWVSLLVDGRIWVIRRWGNDNEVGYGQQSLSQLQKIHNQPHVPHNSGGSGSNNFISNNNINAPNSGYDLPSTECAVGFKCVSELFCDQTGTMVSYRVSTREATVLMSAAEIRTTRIHGQI